AAVVEGDPRAGDEVADGPGDEHLAGRSRRGDPGADMHRDPGQVPVPPAHLARMQAAPNLEAGTVQGVTDVARAADRSRGPVEGCENAVARPADEVAAMC